ncbi:hypothetical protein QFZ26_000546 [Agromyces ramosus]|uniref:DUF3054 family protein n=2 Tax=Agromyces ramosus TaxID=33879 RepID=A0ABU0R733_9MICO|nr:hypothetical protein [Agromyces ramosus]
MNGGGRRDPYDGSMTEPSRASAIITAALLDTAAVVVFVLIGRRSHAEGLELIEVWGTAWPFLVALATGWLVARAWRHPIAVWPSAIVIWVVTLIGGMLLRAMSGQGTDPAFVIVAASVLAAFLIGWRLLARVVATLTRRRSRANSVDA